MFKKSGKMTLEKMKIAEFNNLRAIWGGDGIDDDRITISKGTTKPEPNLPTNNTLNPQNPQNPPLGPDPKKLEKNY